MPLCYNTLKSMPKVKKNINMENTLKKVREAVRNHDVPRTSLRAYVNFAKESGASSVSKRSMVTTQVRL